MKRLIALILVMVTLITLVACGKDKTEKYCWSCGQGVSKDVAFCEHCGASVKDNQKETSTNSETSGDIASTVDKNQPAETPTTTTKPQNKLPYSAQTELFEYWVSSSGEVTITGVLYTDFALLENVIIPEKIDGYQVTTIGNDAFINCMPMTSVTIPEGVKIIERNAFLGCTSLASVTLPNSVISIHEESFWSINKQAKIYFKSEAQKNKFASCFASSYEAQLIVQ